MSEIEANCNKDKLDLPPDSQANLTPEFTQAQPGQAVPEEPDSGLGFPVVGIGASAGGIVAFESFFAGMPEKEDPGMAFVLVQHLAPDHKSILSDLIRRYTRMQVFEVVDGMKVQPNCAYIIAPNRDMAFLNGTLQLLEPSSPRGVRLPIDFFFRSLAQDQHERSICVVLSGSGSDGSLGVRAIKGEGGLVMAQDPESADYDGMPRSAISTGLVDFILPPRQMAGQLIAYARHGAKKLPLSTPATTAGVESGNILAKISVILRTETGHDLSCYKPNTLLRRVERRMSLNQIDEPDVYLRLLRETPGEAQALFRDVLIGVTNFFRDPDAFAYLQNEIFPHLLNGKHSGSTVRVWCCGCSTGEEAYSIAILLQEYMEKTKRSFKIQVFATDLSREAIEYARAGYYPANIAADVLPERLSRFFTLDEGGINYHVRKSLRDLLIFSEQNIINDPPFSRLDLISCRNLLIYLNSNVQERLIPLFHYALNPKGVLMLGPSETVGEFTRLFSALNRKWRIYRRREEPSGAARPGLGQFSQVMVKTREHVVSEAHSKDPHTSLRTLVEQSLLAHNAQSAVLIDSHGEILHIYGRTGIFLEPAAGDAGMNILAMAREGLQRSLATALHNVVISKDAVCYRRIKVRTNGNSTLVNLTVRPATNHKGTILPDRFLVILEETSEPPLPQAANQVLSPGAPGSEVQASPEAKALAEMEEKLREKDEYAQAALEEMQTSNEELRSANEEMQSINEELQSTNEELETSKEELQSVNEELSTVNAELQNKLNELSLANNDMNNLLSATGVATLFVDLQLRIKRFTPSAAQMINLIQADIGRPVGHIVSNLVGYNSLVEDTQRVLDDLVPREMEVKTQDGVWFLLRIRPYRTLDNVIEGAVITFADITELEKCRNIVWEPQEIAKSVIDALHEPLLVLTADLHVLSASPSFYRTFKMVPDETIGKKLFDLSNRDWDIPDLKRLLKKELSESASISDFRITHTFKQIGCRDLVFNVRRINHPGDQPNTVLLTIDDITENPKQESLVTEQQTNM